jgi:hypothetical protein
MIAYTNMRSLRRGNREMKSKRGVDEKRLTTRYPFNVTVMVQELSPQQETPPAAIGGVSRNVSDTGMCLSTAKPLTYAAVVRCDVTVSDPPVSIPTMAQVRWVERRHGAEYRSGLAYIL